MREERERRTTKDRAREEENQEGQGSSYSSAGTSGCVGVGVVSTSIKVVIHVGRASVSESGKCAYVAKGTGNDGVMGGDRIKMHVLILLLIAHHTTQHTMQQTHNTYK